MERWPRACELVLQSEGRRCYDMPVHRYAVISLSLAEGGCREAVKTSMSQYKHV